MSESINLIKRLFNHDVAKDDISLQRVVGCLNPTRVHTAHWHDIEFCRVNIFV